MQALQPIDERTQNTDQRVVVVLRNRLLLGLWLVLLLLHSPAWADRIGNLYEATVAVSDQSDEQRQLAIRQALDIAVVKLSGQQQALNNAQLRAALTNASGLVQQYQYLQWEPELLALSVQFQKPAMDRLLQRHGIPVWGRSRPELMTWLAIDDGRNRYLAQPETHHAARILQRIADNRGIPAILPLMDLEDRRAIDFNDVWGGFEDRIQQASRRYGGDHILAIRLLRLTDGGWHARFTLHYRRETGRWQSRGDDLQSVLMAGYAQVADQLAQNYAPQSMDVAQGIRLNVAGLDAVQGFARVSNYLASLDRVQTLSWIGYADGQAVFDVVYLGDTEDFEKTLALGRVISPDQVPGLSAGPDPSAAGAAAVPTGLFYRLNP